MDNFNNTGRKVCCKVSLYKTASGKVVAQSIAFRVLLLRPSSFHRHRGGWLPANHHRHRGVVQYSRRSFRCCFLKTAVTVRRAAILSLNAASFDLTRRVRDTAHPSCVPFRTCKQHDGFHILRCITDRLCLQLPRQPRSCTK